MDFPLRLGEREQKTEEGISQRHREHREGENVGKNAIMKHDADIDILACRNHLRRRQERQRQTNRQLWEQAKADADAIIQHVVRTRRPKQVLQWGSVLHPEHFTPRSDIDIAIDGDFTAADWFDLLGELWQMTAFPLDLIDLNRIEPEFADIIRMKGKVVYDRDQNSH